MANTQVATRDNTAVANSQPKPAARRHVMGWWALLGRTSHASAASAASCSHHCGAPLPGSASDAACARPASSANAQCHGGVRGRTRAKDLPKLSQPLNAPWRPSKSLEYAMADACQGSGAEAIKRC